MPVCKHSEYIGAFKEGKLNSERQCKLDEKTFVQERITNADLGSSFDISIFNSNFPMIREMKARYQLNKLSNDKTRVKLIVFVATSPGFMVYIMERQMKKLLKKTMVGLRNYLEKGEEVTRT